MKYLLLCICLVAGTVLNAQKQVRAELRKGNKEYNQEKYTEAEIAYLKALEANAQSKEAAYNLGSALYRQGKFDEAAKQYNMSAEGIKEKTKIAEAFHNSGNSFLAKAISADQQQDAGGQNVMGNGAVVPAAGQDKMQSLEQSVAAFKQSLRNNPADDETRYNLALAQKLLEQEKQNQQNQQDQQNQKQDKKDQQQHQDQQQQQHDQQQEQQQQQQQQMERDKAQQILEAMKQNERETQEKVKEQQMRQIEHRKKDKNW